MGNMAPLEQSERDAIANKASQVLANTRYASKLIPLTGGTANFVFRGVLVDPITTQDGTVATTVIVKHSTNFVAVNKDFPLDVSRCIYEESMLNALNNFLTAPTAPSVKSPRLYLFDRGTNTQVLEDFPAAIDLKSILISPTNNDTLTPPIAAAIGRDLGSWLLRSFHSWTSVPAQAELRAVIAQDKSGQELKQLVTYDSFLKVLENFPELLEGTRHTLEQVKATATMEFKEPAVDDGEDWVLLHGDFWTGKVTRNLGVLISNIPSPQTEHPGGANLFIVDWERAQYGHRGCDLAQMIGCLYERKHFKDAQGAVSAIEGFVNGYGEIDDDFAFRTAINTGMHLIGWHTRRPPNAPFPFPLEKVTEAMNIGRDFILKGWEKDRDWFLDTPLASLFKR